MNGIMGGMGLIGSLIFLVLIIMIPISIYAAQKWAYKCFKELQQISAKMDMLLRVKGVKLKNTQVSPGVDIIDR